VGSPRREPRSSSARDPQLARLAASLGARQLAGARIALVLGSGLGELADRLGATRRVPFSELDGMPASSVQGHAGSFAAGSLGGVDWIAAQGRAHLYEGRSALEVTRAVRALAAVGAQVLVLTNAAGGLRPEWKSGTLMRVVDHLNLQGATPLASGEAGYGAPYDAELGEQLELAAGEAEIALERGVYAGLRGPSYETPAEIEMLRAQGVDAVGMSTVLEALAGRAAGMRVAALALIANPAAGLACEPLSHEAVVAAGRAASERLAALLRCALPRLSALCA
jgi:purine-nucleoside phosphorylase